MSKIKGFGRIGVLAGGPSSEREISLKSGRAVFDALVQEGCEAVFLDVYDDIREIAKPGAIDIAFIALHGKFGEDGTVQRILEEANIPYTGSGAEASRCALDKIASKMAFAKAGIPTPAYAVFSAGSFSVSDARRLGLPVVVKPQYEGSSIGLSIVGDPAGLEKAAEEAFNYGRNILFEKYINGRELTVGILDDKPLPPIEIVTKHNVYDYRAKYIDEDTKYVCPAPITDAQAAHAKELARRSHAALGCRSFSRVDMMMDGRGDIFVLEVNTIPGMTGRSLLPKAAAAIGLHFNALCIKLVEDALDSCARRKKERKSHEEAKKK